MKKWLIVIPAIIALSAVGYGIYHLTDKSEVQVNSNIVIKDVVVNRSYYHPGEEVSITVDLGNLSGENTEVAVVLSVKYLMNEVHQEKRKVDVGAGTERVTFSYLPPRETPAGYGVEISVLNSGGTILAEDSTAFDVLENWTQNPRYGFLTDFYPDRQDAAATLALLNHYHINGLQFYDWMYRHEQFLTTEDPYLDLWSPKPKSIKTVDGLIDAAHQYGMAAMPYTAIYGSSRDYALLHPEMVLYTRDGKMYEFGGDKMMIMDPRPGTPWTKHLMAEFKDILDQTDFNGIHIDQYGDPKFGFDQNGNRYELAPAIVDFVNGTKALTNQYTADDAVVFNLVNNWPVEDIATSDEDFVYIEVWEPNTWFANLHQIIVRAQALSGGKPVVLACYIDPTFEQTAIINEAVIFASGGGHIEMGENDGMLAEAYFPNYKVISPALSTTLQNYYDFSVRYQNVTGPGTVDATKEYQGKVKITGVSTSTSQMKDTVWPLVRKSKGSTAINLVNFLGISQIEWNKEVPNKPTAMRDFQMTVEVGQKRVADVWFASPDMPAVHQQLEYSFKSGLLTVEVPALDYWSMIVIDWK